MADKITFSTRQEAIEYLADCREFKPGRWTPRGTYYLSHGEYEAPTYRIRKVRGVEAYEIYAEYFYYSGTFRAPTNGALTLPY